MPVMNRSTGSDSCSAGKPDITREGDHRTDKHHCLLLNFEKIERDTALISGERPALMSAPIAGGPSSLPYTKKAVQERWKIRLVNKGLVQGTSDKSNEVCCTKRKKRYKIS